MIPEFGLFFLVLSFVAALFLSVIPLIGIVRCNTALMRSAPYYAVLQFLAVALAYGCLTLSFLRDDFSVVYVMNNSSVLLPWYYKLCAVWGGHEGSMLLWVSILSFWMVLVALLHKPLAVSFHSRILVVLGLLSIGFLLFLLVTSNPFLRQFNVLDTTGRDLNPLLQDFGFLLHPPTLYMGYVGFCVAFSFAIAALWQGEVLTAWTKWTRPWTLIAWCFLTAGITLGSWWAYRELGWGGFWFWDPVENASFMPWLIGTALLHSLAVAQKRAQFKAWTMLLAIGAFSLSLIGTFLVRSGVLTSVHAFAVDPKRGLFILGFLGVVIGGSLLLFVFRADSVRSKEQLSPISREGALLLNNVFLVVLMLTVLLGTVYPLLIDGLGLGKLSVGAPYFNEVFVPLFIPVLIIMGFVMHMRWGKDNWRDIFKKTQLMVILSVLLPLIVLYVVMSTVNLIAYLGVSLSCWVLLNTLYGLWQRTSKQGLMTIGRSYLGMVVAHCGVAICVIGIAVSVNYGMQDDVVMRPGDSTHLADIDITFVQQQEVKGANYTSVQAKFNIQSGKRQRIIMPEKRRYTIGQMAMSEAAIDVSPWRDVYIALGEPLDNNAWSVRIYYKPLVRWIWGGGFLILLGGAIALLDKRYYARQRTVEVAV